MVISPDKSALYSGVHDILMGNVSVVSRYTIAADDVDENAGAPGVKSSHAK
jgi:hypothetical protein